MFMYIFNDLWLLMCLGDRCPPEIAARWAQIKAKGGLDCTILLFDCANDGCGCV